MTPDEFAEEDLEDLLAVRSPPAEHHRPALGGCHPSQNYHQHEIDSVLAMGQREFRVQRDRLLEAFLGARKQVRTKESSIVPRLQQSLISGQARLVLHERRGRSGKL